MKRSNHHPYIHFCIVPERFWTGLFLMLLCLLSLPVPLVAQRTYYGDLSVYDKSLRDALSRFYQLSVDCALDSEDRAMLIYGIENNFLMPTGVFIPDLVRYDRTDAVVTYENYVLSFTSAYAKNLKKGQEVSSRQQNFKILGAEWTEDRKGVLMNVSYDNELLIGGKSVFKGKSQAVVCFPDSHNMLLCRFQQITPYGWNPAKVADSSRSTSTPSGWFDQAMKHYYAFEYNKAFQLLKRKADEGEPDAWGFLGNLYQRGWGIQTDSVKAAECYRMTHQYDTPLCLYFQSINYVEGRAGYPKDSVLAYNLAKRSAGYNIPWGINLLGDYLCSGVGTKVDYEKAIKCFNKVIKMGNPMGYFNLAFMYALGQGVQVDFEKSFQYQMEANKRGQCNFGLLAVYYKNGWGCETDTLKSLENARKGAEYNDNLAQQILGNWYMQRVNDDEANAYKAVYYLDKSDKAGNIGAGRDLAVYYATINLYQYQDYIIDRLIKYNEASSTTLGEEDYILSEIYLNHKYYYKYAFYYCNKAVKHGNISAKDKLGHYYYWGLGLEQPDYPKAYKLFTECIQSGKALFSYYGAAVCLFEGKGVEKNIDLAKEYIRKGCQLGSSNCLYLLGDYTEEGKYGYPQNNNVAEDAYTKGAKLNDNAGIRCMCRLGLMHAQGKTRYPDKEEAFRLWDKAAKLGEGYASYLIGFAYENGYYGKSVDLQKARQYYQIGSRLNSSVADKALRDLETKLAGKQ